MGTGINGFWVPDYGVPKCFIFSFGDAEGKLILVKPFFFFLPSS